MSIQPHQGQQDVEAQIAPEAVADVPVHAKIVSMPSPHDGALYVTESEEGWSIADGVARNQKRKHVIAVLLLLCLVAVIAVLAVRMAAGGGSGDAYTAATPTTPTSTDTCLGVGDACSRKLGDCCASLQCSNIIGDPDDGGSFCM